ncbi:AGZA family xanthine/uracil permease-like MFS transporter [Weissella uvarum]|uniref:solute carrier family 23 protein n=1 Tax=Weissella uvarum TaxID=1479233 RepID=UPI0019613F4F|nr:AGZA family xanthine/uracil permease-like MFS transporter [Weissella uvarum]MCM0595960.1 NCS2 family permease [Weissella uvarum]
MDFFKLKNNGTTVKAEVLAGFTTFISMSYILFVQPEMLAQAGMDKGAVFTATALVSIFGTLMMALIANMPIAISTGMGINSAFVFSVILQQGYSFQAALSAMLLAGLLYLVVVITPVRDWILNIFPDDLKSAISAGIGLLIATIGLTGSGIIVADKATFTTLGNLMAPQALLTIAGILITLALYYYRVPGAIFLGMLATTLIGFVTGLVHAPSQIVSTVPSVKPTFGVAFTHLSDVLNWQIIPIVLTFFLVAFFDTTGTILGVQKQMHTNRDTNKSLIASALGNISAAIFGTSPATAFVESNAGVSAGGRTGLTSVVVAILFALSLFFSPLLTVITPQITASALIVVGVLMLGNLKEIDWSNFKIAASAFLIVLGMPLTHSISDGILLGGVTYIVLTAMDWIKNKITK